MELRSHNGGVQQASEAPGCRIAVAWRRGYRGRWQAAAAADPDIPEGTECAL